MCFPVTHSICPCNAANVWLGGSQEAQRVGKITAGRGPGWSQTWASTLMAMNQRLQRGQQELTARHCWEGHHGRDLRCRGSWTCPGHNDIIPATSDQAQRKMSWGDFPERHLWRTYSFHEEKNPGRGRSARLGWLLLQSERWRSGPKWGHGWKDRYPPCRGIMALLANPSYNYGLGKQVFWETENRHMDAGTADCLYGKGMYPSASWVVVSAAWLAPGKWRAWQQCLQAYGVLVKAS